MDTFLPNLEQHLVRYFRQAISTTAQDTCLHTAQGAVLSEARLKHAHLHTEMPQTALHALCAISSNLQNTNFT